MSSLRLPATMENLNTLIGILSGCIQEKGRSEKMLHEIELASEEALVNIITHAYPGKDLGDVEVTCCTEGHCSWLIASRDWGIPFDVTACPEPDLEAPISNRKIGGLGIPIIRKMVHQMNYRREEDGNILTFIVRMDS